jgi:hypothetical protein
MQQTQYGGARRDMGDAPPRAHLRRRPAPDQPQRGQPSAILRDDERPAIEQPELPFASRSIGGDKLDRAMSGIDGRAHRNRALCHEPEETLGPPELDRHPTGDHRDHYGARKHGCHPAGGDCLRRWNQDEEQQPCCRNSLGQPENHDSDPKQTLTLIAHRVQKLPMAPVGHRGRQPDQRLPTGMGSQPWDHPFRCSQCVIA